MTQTRIVAEAQHVLRGVLRLSRLIGNVERHLLEDQHEAVARASSPGTRPSGIGDPTPGLAAALAPFAAREQQLFAAIRTIDKALDNAERACVRVLAYGTQTEDPTIRCPGWNAELRARVGGCGKPIEFWTDSQGVQHNRATLLCRSCRAAEERSTTCHDH